MIIDKPLLGEDIYLDPSFADGLVGCWLFNDSPPLLGKTFDVSGYGNHGTLFGDTHFVPGKFGPALSFGGAGYVSTSLLPVIGTGDNFSCSMWIRYGADTGTTKYLMAAYNGAEYIYFGRLENSSTSNKFDFIIRDGTNSIVSTFTSPDWNDGNWHHVVMVKNGSDGIIYLDGVVRATATQALTSKSLDRVFFIGARNNQGTADFFFNGFIDHVMISNRAWSDFEIAKLYCEPFWGFRKKESGIYTRI